MIARSCLLALFLAVYLCPQGVIERSRAALPEDEKKAIAEARAGAKPRPFVARKKPLAESERARIQAFEAAKNSVVQIILKEAIQGGSQVQSRIQGSGVVWDQLGHIVTNYHLVASGNGQLGAEQADSIALTVLAADGAEYGARVVGAIPRCDLALLKVDTPIKGAKPILLGRSSELAVGRSVLALGNPYGYDHSLTSGIVSALDRVILSPSDTPINGVIQTDASVNPGNSGGPLLDSMGQMVGLNTAFASPSGWSAGINFAIPSQTVIEEIGALLSTNREAAPLSPISPKEAASAKAFGQAVHSVVGIHASERRQDFRSGSTLVDPIGSGTGVVWDSLGHIVTNFHVVAVRDPMRGSLVPADLIIVTTSDGAEVRAHLVGARPSIDVAVLKMENLPNGIKPMSLGSASSAAVGQSVLALGNPFGENQSLTAGIISALNRTIASSRGEPIDGALQTDAAINPGNSGGPLMDLDGRMLGINTMIISTSGANANIGFAIPVDLICREIEQIVGKSQTSETPLAAPLQEDKGRAEVFARAHDSVVYVHAETEKFDFRDNWSGRVYSLRPESGTGIVWDTKGHIITSYSAVLIKDPLSDQVTEADKLKVTLADGNTYRARIIGRSMEYGLAVLRVFAPFKDLRPLPLARPGDIKVGQDLYAIGNPFGLDYSLSSGILSALRDSDSGPRGAIQTDAAINYGNIGGPMLDSEGRLVGMGFFIEGPQISHAGINLGLSSGTLNRIVPLLLKKGQVERPVLGFVSLSAIVAGSYFGVHKGVVIQYVEADSPAFKAGLKGLKPSKDGRVPEVGDVIVGLRGKSVDNQEALWDLIEQEPADGPLSFDVMRDGKRIKVIVSPTRKKNKDISKAL
ncbi:MAG: trypsin-like peptidase domain-containing protein [Holophagales bacterium]|jgi:S1-C subfamily serine protease|nr:trypsin-like peptidase domain-containing protein [Holophagales bacterium]